MQVRAQNNPNTIFQLAILIYDITFSIFQNTTKWNELFFHLKRTTFEYVLSSEWWINVCIPYKLYLGAVVAVIVW